MNLPKDVVAWFEIPVLDFHRARKFYSEIYRYNIAEYPMGQNLMGFLPMEQGDGIGGAIVKGDGYIPSKTGIKLYLHGGDDLIAILDRIEPSGGKIILGKTKITDEIGFFAVFEDTEGNYLSLHSRK